MAEQELYWVFFSVSKEWFSCIWSNYSFKHMGFISVGISAVECDKVVSDRLPRAYIWSFQLLPPGSLRGDQKAWGWQVAMQSAQMKGLSFTVWFFFFFSSSLSPASNSLACTNLHLLYPLLQIMALRSKPVPLIHIEGSRRWIIGIKIVPQTRLGHEPGPLIVLVAAWGVFTEWGVWSSTASWNLAMEHLESAKSGFSHEKQCH